MNSHCHSEASSHDDHEHDHGHDHEDEEDSANTLFPHIDLDNVVAHNVDDGSPCAAKGVFKQWSERMDEELWIESDRDDDVAELLIRVPFTKSVKLQTILLKAGPADQTPSEMRLYPNLDVVGFDEIQDLTPAQVFQIIPQSSDIGKYNINRTMQSKQMQSLTIHFPGSQGADTAKVYYLGLRGKWTDMKKERDLNIVYELNPVPKEHPKIAGIDGQGSQLGM